MSALLKCPKNLSAAVYYADSQAVANLSVGLRRCSMNAEKVAGNNEEFRVLEIVPKKDGSNSTGRRTRRKIEKLEEIYKNVDDWTNVWVGPKTFLPDAVPLPVRQGYRKRGVQPSKYGNAELMKIPNFLHLTPPAIKKHCDALKKFCTPWPKDLNTPEDMERHFPVTIAASDYCHSSTSIRNPLSRIITLQVKLSSLQLNKHARDKLLRLVGERYDNNTGCLNITTDNCPLKKQNYDYALYLLTALYYESWKKEEWEKTKSEEDMEKYIFANRQERRNLDSYFAYCKKEVPDTRKLGRAIEKYITNVETPESVKTWKNEMIDVLGLPQY